MTNNCFRCLVIGGLAWAITASSMYFLLNICSQFLNIFFVDVDVEVDVFFQEEARLGDQMYVNCFMLYQNILNSFL